MVENKQRILVVEDNPSSLSLIRFVLEDSGITVYEARDGLEGVEKALELKPDLILMDIQLPEIDGLEATRRIRQHPEMRTMPIVAVTSYVMPGDRQRALDAGCNGYIEKPINTDTIVEEMRSYLA